MISFDVEQTASRSSVSSLTSIGIKADNSLELGGRAQYKPLSRNFQSPVFSSQKAAFEHCERNKHLIWRQSLRDPAMGSNRPALHVLRRTRSVACIWPKAE